MKRKRRNKRAPAPASFFVTLEVYQIAEGLFGGVVGGDFEGVFDLVGELDIPNVYSCLRAGRFNLLQIRRWVILMA
jgi:hypothetical protein